MTRERLAEIYAKVPSITCTGKCWQACAMIPVQRAELVQIRKAAGDRDVTLLPGVDGHGIMALETMQCPMLDVLKRCSIYEVRPLICRIFGVADGLPCPFGCVPERVLSKPEVLELVRATRRALR